MQVSCLLACHKQAPKRFKSLDPDCIPRQSLKPHRALQINTKMPEAQTNSPCKHLINTIPRLYDAHPSIYKALNKLAVIGSSVLFVSFFLDGAGLKSLPLFYITACVIHCLGMCVYVCLYIHICLHVHIDVHSHVCVDMYTYPVLMQYLPYVYMCVNMCIYTHTGMHMTVWIDQCTSTSLSACMHLRIRVCVSVCMYVYIYVSIIDI